MNQHSHTGWLTDMTERIAQLKRDLAAAQADKEKWKALAEASAQLLETQASIRERDKRLADAERDEARAEAAALRDAKDDAYLERNMCVAALSKLFPATVSRTAIEGWSEDWHGCVYIDLPTGQVSWHFHDSQAHLFAHLPHGWVKWDGHDTPEKYARLAAIEARKEGA